MADPEAAWSSVGGLAAIRISGEPTAGRVEIRPWSDRPAGSRPPMLGTVISDGNDLLFLPRYPFADGTSYEVAVAGRVIRVLQAPQHPRPAAAAVVEIRPTASVVPVNLLRFSVQFSLPMSEGHAASHVRLTDPTGDELEGALLSTDYELWDVQHRRLTVLLDPGRIKRGLADHTAAGYPLRQGQPFRLVVDQVFADAGGAPLIREASRHYDVGGVLSGRLDPLAWHVGLPTSATIDPVTIAFDRPLDHALLSRCVQVIGPDGSPVPGDARIGAAERFWSFRPRHRWTAEEHRIRFAPVLEDVAGNSLLREFDRDLTDGIGGRSTGSVDPMRFTPS